MLIFYAHPNKDGHCGFALKKVLQGLKAKKEQYTLFDLYKMSYDPSMKNSEHYTSGHFSVSRENRKIQKQILNENKFLFIYPTWWSMPPAILKGFFDRVFTSKFAFEYKNGLPYGLLSGKKAAVFTTTGGIAIFDRIVIGNCSLKTVSKNILQFCGFKTKGFVVDRATKFDPGQKRKINRKVKEVLSYLI